MQAIWSLGEAVSSSPIRAVSTSHPRRGKIAGMTLAADLVLVLDAGTTSTRAIAFDAEGSVRAATQQDITQHYPRPGWVEHDADEIWHATLACARKVVAACGAAKFAAIGVTNQRETVVAWDRASGEPLHRALVWQDRRTADACAALREAGHEAAVQDATGLVLDPYFSATKMRWLIDNVPEVGAAAASGRLALGTIESWLVWKLTGGVFISDASNASRTSLLGLTATRWDAGLCDVFGVPENALAEVTDNAGDFGRSLPDLLGTPVPVTGLAGDQQSATIGHGCLSPGETKATFGTGAFVLTNLGAAVPKSRNRLLGTILCQMGGQRSYALEGAVFVAGSLIKWLRDRLGLLGSAEETEALARSVPDSGGVVIVPALSGLGAPHWLPDARASVTGLSFSTTRAHLARAALEAMAFQMHDLAEAFAADGAGWARLRVDGGMSANDWMVQDIADLLAIPVERPALVEATALGAAILAGVGCGLHGSLEQAANAMGSPLTRFEPVTLPNRDERVRAWQDAVARLK
jgi:glycerol kinase